jgi:hypothetical protein
MSKEQLTDLWKELFGRKAPPQIRRGLVIRILAYKIQEQAHGGLSSVTQKHLRELASRFEADPNADVSGVIRIKVGTRLIREWRGQSHHVTVLENGYEYAGKRYPSLSQIARLIAGTRCSGPLFFGLRGNHARGNPGAR